MNLRTYQQRTIDALYNWWCAHPGIAETPLMVLPTGAGKSHVIAELVRLLFDTWPESHPRTVVLVPSKELAEQNAEKLAGYLPTHISIGYYSASLGRKVPNADVIVATIGSIYKDAHLLGNIKCVIIDECFTAETLVKTTRGSKRIDSVCIGDSVYTATGIGIIEAVSKKSTKSIFTVRLSDGTEIRTTDNHPFFTARGWVNAKDLACGDGVVRLQDMPELWKGLLSLGQDSGEWKGSDPVSAAFREGKILLNLLLKEKRECNVGSWGKGEDGEYAQENSPQAIAAGWKRQGNDRSSESSIFDFIEWLDAGIGHKNRIAEGQRTVPDELQSGYRQRSAENSNRAGWKQPCGETQDTGREERRDARFTWVESVSREELSSPEPVFNLQVSGHPSYFAGNTLVHNCHLVNPDGKEAGRFRKFLNDLAKTCNFRVVGTTATPFRGNGVWLTDGEDPLFTGIAATVTVGELLEAGYLAPLIRPIDAITAHIDTTGVKTTGGDYNIAELSERIESALPGVAENAVKLAVDRKKWIAFTATVENAQHLRNQLQQRGITCAVVTGDTPAADRKRFIAEFRAGHIRCLVTVLALATGFDVPDVDCIIWCRPTISPVLYVQGAGRGLRIAPGKTDCLWLDFSDTTERLGPVDAIKGRKKRKSKAEESIAPHRICDNCGERCPIHALECPSCGFQFPEPEPDNDPRTASNAAIMAHQVQPKIVDYEISDVRYSIHQKEGKPDSLRVDYYAGLRRVGSEWVCFEHQGFARAKAEQWWDKRYPGEYPAPRTSSDANQRLIDDVFIRTPTAIRVNETGKYPEIIGYQWEAIKEAA